jgi:hypothetical protein
MAQGLGSAIIVIVAAIAFMRWQERRGLPDPEPELREGEYVLGLVRRIAFVLATLVAALFLASRGVPGAAVIAVLALFVFMAAMFVGPRQRD